MSYAYIKLPKLSTLAVALLGSEGSAWPHLLDELSCVLCTFCYRGVVRIHNEPHDAIIGISQRNSGTGSESVVF